MHRLNRAQIALSNKFNSTSVIVTSTSLEEGTKILLGDVAQTRLDVPCHVPPFDLAHDIPRGILQLVIASIHFLLMFMLM